MKLGVTLVHNNTLKTSVVPELYQNKYNPNMTDMPENFKNTNPHWPESNWRSTVLSGFTRTVTHNFGVDSATHTVQQFSIQLGQSVH